MEQSLIYSQLKFELLCSEDTILGNRSEIKGQNGVARLQGRVL